jgi:hypothetical protein
MAFFKCDFLRLATRSKFQSMQKKNISEKVSLFPPEGDLGDYNLLSERALTIEKPKYEAKICKKNYESSKH